MKILTTIGIVLAVLNAVLAYTHGNPDSAISWSAAAFWALAYWAKLE